MQHASPLEAARVAAGLTKQGLSDRTKAMGVAVSVGTISGVERGKLKLSRAVAAKLAKALACDPGVLLPDLAPRPPQRAA